MVQKLKSLKVNSIMSSSPNRIVVESPSNIAFIKYWGKYGRQYPTNPSISMTLKNCKTIMDLEYTFEKSGVELFFEDELNEKFSLRIEKYLCSIEDILPEAKDLGLKIKSTNTFPHSAGIASSASAMSALGFALDKICTENKSIPHRASQLARLASGSASRSLMGPYAIWGEHDLIPGSSNDYALEATDIHENFLNMNDSILLIDKGEKSVSSSAGHALMNSHPYKEARVSQANENFRVMMNALATGDYDSFGNVLENEALSLHALMLTSDPSYILLKPLSLEFIQRLKFFRKEMPVYFTIDAGPNIHVIYPDSIKDAVVEFIEAFTKEHKIDAIHDSIGTGAKVLS